MTLARQFSECSSKLASLPVPMIYHHGASLSFRLLIRPPFSWHALRRSTKRGNISRRAYHTTQARAIEPSAALCDTSTAGALNGRKNNDNMQQGDEYNPSPVLQSIGGAATEELLKECARQADYTVPQAFERSGKVPKNTRGEEVGEGTGYWYEDMGLDPTFSNWAQVTMLHLYLLIVRIRYFPPEQAEKLIQQLLNHFFYEAEHRMTIFHNIGSRMARNRHLKDLYGQWRGVQSAYDEGLVKGDAVLGAAVWRNIFKADSNVDWQNVALIVSFMRRGLRGLDRIRDKTVLTAALQFGNPVSEAQIVARRSEGVEENI